MPDTAESRSQTRRIAFLLFLTLNFFYLILSSGRVRSLDEVSVAFQTESLVTTHSTSIPQALSSNLFYGKLDLQGRPQSPYGLGQALLVAPWYYSGRLFADHLPGIPPESRVIFLDATLVASNATFAALAVTTFFLLLTSIGCSFRNSLLSSFMLAFATPLLGYSTWFFSEPIGAFLLLATSYTLFAIPAERLSTPRALIAGFLLGVLLWTRPTHVIAAPVFLFALLFQDRKNGWRVALQTGVVVALFGGLYLLRNQLLFGNLFDFGYPSVAEGGKQLNSFHTPLLTGLFGFLLSPGKSVFLFAPPLVLALIGIKPLLARSRGLALVAAITPLLYLFFFAGYTQWEGGFCVGPRYLLPAICLLCVAIGPLLEAKPAWLPAARIVLIAGFIAQVPSVATSFLEDQVGGRYYDQHFNYRMDYNPLVSQTKLLLHYATSALPARLGLGFDRWFLFLTKAHISPALVFSFLFVQVVAVLVCALLLRRHFRSATTGSLNS